MFHQPSLLGKLLWFPAGSETAVSSHGNAISSKPYTGDALGMFFCSKDCRLAND